MAQARPGFVALRERQAVWDGPVSALEDPAVQQLIAR
jgi:hypothetical protein